MLMIRTGLNDSPQGLASAAADQRELVLLLFHVKEEVQQVE
jgi:hypothetical protein